MKGILSTTDLDDASLVAKAQASPGLVGRDLAREVMPPGVSTWDRGLDATYRMAAPGGQAGESAHPQDPADARRPHVVALDFGMKWNILRHLVDLGCKVTVVPGSSTADEILDFDPDGIFLSNGPGDPAALTDATATLRTLIRTAAGSRGNPDLPGERQAFSRCQPITLWSSSPARRSNRANGPNKGRNGHRHGLASERTSMSAQSHADPPGRPVAPFPAARCGRRRRRGHRRGGRRRRGQRGSGRRDPARRRQPRRRRRRALGRRGRRPLVVYLRDAASGELDIFSGTSHTVLRDPALVARLTHAVR